MATGLSNREFLELYARAGRIGLSGGVTLVDKAICRAERHLDEGAVWGFWSHVFLFEGLRLDGHHWLIESDLQIHRKHIQLGVQENRICKYFDEGLYTSLAVLDLGLTEAQVACLLREGLELVASRARYSLRELFGTLIALHRPELRARANVLARERSLYCSALLQHVFRADRARPRARRGPEEHHARGHRPHPGPACGIPAAAARAAEQAQADQGPAAKARRHRSRLVMHSGYARRIAYLAKAAKQFGRRDDLNPEWLREQTVMIVTSPMSAVSRPSGWLHMAASTASVASGQLRNQRSGLFPVAPGSRIRPMLTTTWSGLTMGTFFRIGPTLGNRVWFRFIAAALLAAGGGTRAQTTPPLASAPTVTNTTPSRPMAGWPDRRFLSFSNSVFLPPIVVVSNQEIQVGDFRVTGLGQASGNRKLVAMHLGVPVGLIDRVIEHGAEIHRCRIPPSPRSCEAPR